MPTVTKIEATVNPITHFPQMQIKKRRVAGYARVSTDSDEQFTSYEAQVDYYTNFIKSNSNWEFVKVYTDEGISGTNTKKREGFNSMIADAVNGKIDLIITKSVSRFARNTVDSLVTIRKLKEHNVEVYFEKENIYTFDGKGEIDKKLEKLSKELETTALSVSEYVNKNASEVLSQDEYINEYTKLTKKYEKKAKQREKLISEKEDKFRRANEIRLYVQKIIETKKSATEWDDTLWVIFLDRAIVNANGTIEFGFKDGSKIPV